jgi:hypothetical protein
MKTDDARNWLRAFSDIPDDLREPCEYGHMHCSNTKGGVCFDDAIQAGVIFVEEGHGT